MQRKGKQMKKSSLLKICAAVGAAAALYDLFGRSSNVMLTGAGYAGILSKDDKPYAAFACTGMRPHTVAHLTARTCGWVCASSAKDALRKREKEAAQKK